MFGKRFSRALAVATVMSLVLASTALADTIIIENTVGLNNNVTKAPGTTGTALLRLDVTNGTPSGDQNGCNAQTSNAVVATVASSNPNVTLNSSTARFTDCTPQAGGYASVGYTVESDATGTATISVTGVSGGKTDGTRLFNRSDTLVITISAPEDSTAPIITPNVTGTLGDNGWYTSDVSLSWTVNDPESTVTSTSGCGSVSITADQGSTTYICSATSAGGTNSNSMSIKRDATAPSIDPANVTNTTWRNSDLSQEFTASDSGSGLANAGDASFTLTASGESANGTTPTVASRTVRDNAGNSSTASVSALIDKASPFISGSDINDETWRNTSLSQGFTASDALSGLLVEADASFTLTASADSTVDAGGNPVPTTVSKTVADRAGNSTARTLSALIDTVAPEISGADVANTTWRNTPLSDSFTASDALSGLANSADASFTLTATNQSSRDLTGAVIPTAVSKTVSDRAGNSTTRTLSAWIDTGAPTVTCAAAPSSKLNQPGVQVSATVADALSGPLSATATANADTSSVGTKTVTVTGYDNAGNSATASCSYTVGYNFEGLSAPVDRPTTLNVSKAGQAIPLKWRLTDYNGVGVTSVTAVTVGVGALSCSTSAGLDTVEEYAGTSGLQNLGDGYYQFNWKTSSSYANSCKTLSIKMGSAADAPVFSNLAHFNFKK